VELCGATELLAAFREESRTSLLSTTAALQEIRGDLQHFHFCYPKAPLRHLARGDMRIPRAPPWNASRLVHNPGFPVKFVGVDELYAVPPAPACRGAGRDRTRGRCFGAAYRKSGQPDCRVRRTLRVGVSLSRSRAPSTHRRIGGVSASQACGTSIGVMNRSHDRAESGSGSSTKR
jgi:hypothetical protein